MSTELEFVQTIRDHPADDLPRLIFADWLEDRGDPRGAFIRTQCALARLGMNDAGRLALEARERQLIAEHASQWLGPLLAMDIDPNDQFPTTKKEAWDLGVGFSGCPDQPDLAWVRRPSFRRGFLDAAQMKAPVFLEHHQTLFRHAPLLRMVKLEEAALHLGELARCPSLERIVGLAFSWEEIGPNRLATLAASPYLGNLRALRFYRNEIGDLGARALAQAPSLTSLVELDVESDRRYENYLTPRGMEYLTRNSRLSGLRFLNLQGNALGPSGARILAARPLFGQLRKLDLSDNDLGDAGTTELARLDRPSQLRHLALHGNSIGDAGAQAIAGSPHMQSLRQLDLSHNAIDTAGCVALATSPYLKGLQRLGLVCNPIGPEGARALANAAPTFTKLSLLRVESSDVYESGYSAELLLQQAFGPRVRVESWMR
ncbi:MAG: TIGR02996 domain-containing protein [Planctomycetia bacterium]|nr:TIGR02996 domain-containing protein [Planctomycetia bacterium]